MKTQKTFKYLFWVIVSIIFSCSTLRKNEGVVHEGKYMVSNVETISENKVKLMCKVYDSKSQKPISRAYIQIKELNIWGFTRDDGSLELELLTGAYIIEVGNVGNTTINTIMVSFKSNTRTERCYFI